MDAPFDQQLVVIRGLPGSGKSTLAKEVAKCGYMHFENDHYFETENGYQVDDVSKIEAKKWCYWSVRNALNSGKKVVVSNVFSGLSHFADYLALTSSHLVIECTGDYGSVHDIPADILTNMKLAWENYPGAIRL